MPRPGELRDRPVEPSSDPARTRTVKLVLHGSVRTVDCGCGCGCGCDEGGPELPVAAPV